MLFSNFSCMFLNLNSFFPIWMKNVFWVLGGDSLREETMTSHLPPSNCLPLRLRIHSSFKLEKILKFRNMQEKLENEVCLIFSCHFCKKSFREVAWNPREDFIESWNLWTYLCLPQRSNHKSQCWWHRWRNQWIK